MDLYFNPDDGWYYPIVYDNENNAFYDISRPYDADGFPLNTDVQELAPQDFLSFVRQSGAKVAYDSLADTGSFVWGGIQYILPFLSFFL